MLDIVSQRYAETGYHNHQGRAESFLVCLGAGSPHDTWLTTCQAHPIASWSHRLFPTHSSGSI